MSALAWLFRGKQDRKRSAGWRTPGTCPWSACSDAQVRGKGTSRRERKRSGLWDWPLEKHKHSGGQGFIITVMAVDI